MSRGDGHTRPLADDLGDVLGVDLLLEHGVGALQLGQPLRRLVDAPLEVGDLAVADLGRPLEVGLALEQSALGLQLLLEGPDRADGVLLLLPAAAHGVGLLAQVGQLLVEAGQAFGGRLVGLLRQCDPLDLELADPPVDHVDLRRHRVDLDP